MLNEAKLKDSIVECKKNVDIYNKIGHIYLLHKRWQSEYPGSFSATSVEEPIRNQNLLSSLSVSELCSVQYTRFDEAIHMIQDANKYLYLTFFSHRASYWFSIKRSLNMKQIF